MISYFAKSLERQLIFYIILGGVFPFLFVTGILFALNRGEMKQQTVENMQQRLELVTRNIEQLVDNVNSVSNHYAYDQSFQEYTQKRYDKDSLERIRDIQQILGMFGNSDPLGNNIRIKAILTKHEEILNLIDPLMSQEGVLKKLEGMNVRNVNNLSKIIWYPLENNYFISELTGDPRQDKVLVGTRRIINFHSGNLNCVHIFVIPEAQIWEKYRNLIAEEDLGKDEFIALVDREGNIISSSDMRMIAKQEKDPLIGKIMDCREGKENGSFELNEEGKKYLISVQAVSNADWMILAVSPLSKVTESIDMLFWQIILILILCVLLCFYIILLISRRFLQPITLLKSSMQEVYNGTMDAYVDMTGEGEIREMGRYYNAMLYQINKYIEDIVETEKKKRQLELEVIMGQVNPHFLYNTLENIVWKASEAGFPEISKLAASLGRMYRLSVSGGKIIIRVQQEIEHLMSYINIQNMRYKERVEFELLVNYEEIRNYMTIKLLLQPAVENCFMYAIEGIDHVLKIWVRIKIFQDSIRFEIIDNGAGIHQVDLQKIRRKIEKGELSAIEENSRKKGSGIGLYSISERIKLYFGKENAVRIRSRKGRGTAVTVIIPLLLSEKDKNRL